MPAAVRVLRDPVQASAVLQPGRLTLLEHLASPDSAAGVARKIDMPRQQVNYHLKELEKHGLVEFVEERRKGNCLERIVQATARTYLVSPEALGKLGTTPEERRDRFSAAWLVSAAARVIRDLAVLGLRSQRAGKRLATLTIETEIRFRSAEERSEFAEELSDTLMRLTAKYHDAESPGGRPFRVLAGVWPMITKKEEDGGESAALE